MEIESFNVREKCLPKSCITTVSVKQYEERVTLDENGIAHSELVEKTSDDFLDVPFRDFSLQTMQVTGEISRLQFVSPLSTSKLDALDRISGDASELSAKLDRMDALAAAAAASESSNVESSNK